MKQQLTDLFSSIIASMGITGVDVLVSRSENPTHGDYTTNIAMLLAGQKKGSPITIANEIKKTLDGQLAVIQKMGGHQNSTQKGQTISDLAGKNELKNVLQDIAKIEVAPPGFINVFINEARLSTQILGLLKSEKSARISQKPTGKKILVEYAHPNTHKAFHIGHLRNITTGECVSRLLDAAGNKVVRVNYQGDVGLHIGKCIYGILHTPNGMQQIKEITNINGKIDFLANAYVKGATAYEAGGEAKEEIERINKQIYAKDPALYPLYEETRSWSLEYFANLYKRLGTRFDHLYFESETYELGKQLVMDGVKQKIFVEDKGAIIFPGEKFGLHNRVFITGTGNATYEAKDMGLAKLQFADYKPNLIIHCVASEQIGYFQVIIEALAQLMPETKGKEKHLVYGWVRLKEGKMSSRTGQVVLAEDLMDNVNNEIRNILYRSDVKYSEREQTIISEACTVAAIKYSFLKVGTTQDIAFDIKESINTNGDSGPYLLYVFARCQSVLRKAEGGRMGAEERKDLLEAGKEIKTVSYDTYKMKAEERQVARTLLYFPEIVEEAADRFAPNILCTYLFTLAQVFNKFYDACPILEAKPIETAFRLSLVEATSKILAQGLYLLGISTVERM